MAKFACSFLKKEENKDGKEQGCIKFLIQVVNREREYNGCWEEYNVKKRERGIFATMLRLLKKKPRRE